MSELRRLLGVLREDAGGAADRAPQPTLAHLDELIDTARATGMPVNFTLRGPVGPLPPGIDLAAYRIVQEALTNARHARGAEVQVNLSYTPETIHLLIRDNGPGPTEDHTGRQGLLGMEERVADARRQAVHWLGRWWRLRGGGRFTCGELIDDHSSRCCRRPGDRAGRVQLFARHAS